MTHNTIRRAFTVLELMVVVAITAVLLGLAVPAVQLARATSLRVTCSNHLRQIGKAMHAHHDAHSALPNNGGGPPSPIPDVNGNPFIVTTSFPPYLINGRYAVGDPAIGSKDQPGSYAFTILPFIEETSIFQNRSWMEGVRLYACPARRTATPQLPMDDEFGTYNGGGWRWGKTDYAANRLAIPGKPLGKALSTFTDGSSQTILVGEKALSPEVALSGSWYHDQPFFLGQHEGVYRIGAAILKDTPGISFVDNWGSAHTSGAHFAFADGSVHLLKYGTARAEMLRLLSPASGD